MSETPAATPDATAQAPTEQPTPEAPAQETDWKAEARKWEERAKANKAAADRLAEIEEASKTAEQKAAERLAELEAKVAAYETEKQVAAWKAEVSKDTGVPAAALAGSTLEDIKAHAETLAPLIAKAPRGPVIPSQGQTPSEAPLTAAQQFAEAFKDRV